MNLRKVVLLLSILGIIVLGVYYFIAKNYVLGVVVLEPEYLIYKKKPDDPGGATIPNAENFVYENLKRNASDSNSQVKMSNYVVPEPEKPLEIIYNQTIGEDIVRSASDGTGDFDSIDSILANIELYEEKLSNQDDQKKSSDISEDEHVMPNPLGEGDFKEELTQDKKIAPILKKDDLEIDGLRIIKASQEMAKLPKIRKIGDGGGGYKLQLSVASSEKDARILWENISSRHSKILQNASMVIRKVEGKNERIFYLVMAGTYPSINQAKLVCKKLAAKKQNCIVTK